MSAGSWQAEQDAHTARAEAVADAVAAHVAGWMSEHDTPTDGERRGNPHLVHAESGARVWVSPVTYGAGGGVRVELSAGVPKEASYSDGDYHGIDRPEITVRSDRATDHPASLARDVERRLLPAAVDYWREILGRIERRTAAANRRETLARELAGIMGSNAEESRNGWGAAMPLRFRDGTPYTYGTLSADSDGTVDVEIRNLTTAEARELAALIAGWRK